MSEGVGRLPAIAVWASGPSMSQAHGTSHQTFHISDGIRTAGKEPPRRVSRDEVSIRPSVALLFYVGLLSAGMISDRAAAARERPPVRSLLETRQEGVVLQKWDLSCGAAALATLLTYQHSDPVSEREIARSLMQRPEYLENPEAVRLRQGFSLLDLKRYVEKRGYRGLGLGQLEFSDLVERAPIIVPVNFYGYNHFVVFRGFVGNRVVLADPAYGNRTLSAARFEEAWLKSPEFGKVGFLVLRGEQQAGPRRMAPDNGDVVAPPDAVLRTMLSTFGRR